MLGVVVGEFEVVLVSDDEWLVVYLVVCFGVLIVGELVCVVCGIVGWYLLFVVYLLCGDLG